MLTMKFFQSVTTLEELKKQYRKLALQHHPDRGGNEKDFIALKEEYDQLFKQLNDTDELSDTYTDIINALMKYSEINIEIIGTWIWVTGETYSIRKELGKGGLGFSYSKKKTAWYWHEGEYKKHHKKTFSLDEIRTMHDSKIIKTSSTKPLRPQLT